MRFVLDGPFKPYVRMTQRGKWVKPEAQAYLSSKAALAYQFAAQMQGPPIERERCLSVAITIIHANGFHNRDLDNEVKAILDAAQGIVFENDCWIDAITARRQSGDVEKIALEIHLT